MYERQQPRDQVPRCMSTRQDSVAVSARQVSVTVSVTVSDTVSVTVSVTVSDTVSVTVSVTVSALQVSGQGVRAQKNVQDVVRGRRKEWIGGKNGLQERMDWCTTLPSSNAPLSFQPPPPSGCI